MDLGWRIAETMAWCAGRARLDELQHCLRSAELRPSLTPGEPLGISAEIVEEMAERRARDAAADAAAMMAKTRVAPRAPTAIAVKPIATISQLTRLASIAGVR